MSEEREDRDLEQRLGRWLRNDAPAMSSEFRGGVRDRVQVTAQLPSTGPTEFRQRWVPRSVRMELLAAAAVLVVAVVGSLAVLQAPPNPGASGLISGQPSAGLPTPSPVASPSPAQTVAPVVDPFAGTWSTVDVDGSVYLVVFEGTGPTRRVTLTDLRGTACAGRTHIIEATGTIDGGSITYEGFAGCLGETLDDPAGSTLTYDPASATLRLPFDYPGGDTLVWMREVQRDAFDGSWAATDTDGSNLTLTFTGSGLTRTVVFEDNRAGACGGRSYTGNGTGTIGTADNDGRFISLDLTGSCPGGPADYVYKFEFVLASNTLSGPLAPLEIGGTPLPSTVTWHRP